MKKYRNSEALAMLENNHKLKFTCEGVYTLFVKNEKIVIQNELNRNLICAFFTDDIWELVQDPVSFIEAIKAYNEGKNIRCEYKNTTSVYKATQRNFPDEVIDEEGLAISSYEILDGKWYIEN